jgi:hypothetical protein
VSKETRRDCVLGLIFFFVSGRRRDIRSGRQSDPAWIAIVVSDLYLLITLLFAAMRSDDESLLHRHVWIADFFPRRAAGVLVVVQLFVAVLSGFAGLYVGTEVSRLTKLPWMPFISAFSH